MWDASIDHRQQTVLSLLVIVQNFLWNVDYLENFPLHILDLYVYDLNFKKLSFLNFVCNFATRKARIVEVILTKGKNLVKTNSNFFGFGMVIFILNSERLLAPLTLQGFDYGVRIMFKEDLSS